MRVAGSMEGRMITEKTQIGLAIVPVSSAALLVLVEFLKSDRIVLKHRLIFVKAASTFVRCYLVSVFYLYLNLLVSAYTTV